MAEQVSSIRLPEREDVEVVLVRLDDGTIVARTRAELDKELSNPHHTEEAR